MWSSVFLKICPWAWPVSVNWTLCGVFSKALRLTESYVLYNAQFHDFRL